MEEWGIGVWNGEGVGEGVSGAYNYKTKINKVID